MTTIGWICNLDADLELADPDGFVPSARLVQQSEVIASSLLAAANAAMPWARHVRLGRSDGDAVLCQAWSPTPRAHAAARELGHTLPAAPPVHVLAKVNHRSFAAHLGLGLSRAEFVSAMPAFDQLMRAPRPAEGWLLKRPFGFSGRGQKRLAGPPIDGDLRWVEASMQNYGHGLMVEPFVAIEAEFALHSWLGRDGRCVTGEPTRLVTDDSGAWRASELGPDLSVVERELLGEASAIAARALAAAAYFGPFSIDAFRYRDEDQRLRFCALSEINARYSMGFFVGMRGCSEEWAQRVRADVSPR